MYIISFITVLSIAINIFLIDSVIKKNKIKRFI